MNSLPAQPREWVLEPTSRGDFVAWRQEWLRPRSLGVLAVAGLLGLALVSAYLRRDYPTAVGAFFSLSLVLLLGALLCLQQKSFSLRGSLLVAEDRRWPSSQRRSQHFDASDAVGFEVRHEAPRYTHEWHGGFPGGWAVFVQLQGGKELRLFSELGSVEEASWLKWLGDRLVLRR